MVSLSNHDLAITRVNGALQLLWRRVDHAEVVL
jgi:hypothetical protein